MRSSALVLQFECARTHLYTNNDVDILETDNLRRGKTEKDGVVMSKGKIIFLVNESSLDSKEEALKDYYGGWREYNKSTSAPFAAIYSSFRDQHLANLEAGPLRLYLYFSFHAHNSTGHSWHSIQTIAKFFNTQTRTIDNWIRVLVEKELIYREKAGKLSNTTFLIPYSDAIIHIRLPRKYEGIDQRLVEDMVKTITSYKEVYGDIIAIYHLFQWKFTKGVHSLDDPHNTLLVLTRRKNDVLIGHVYRTKSLKKYGVDEIETDMVSTFESPLKYDDKSITGIFVKNDVQIFAPKNLAELSNIVHQLAEIDEENLGMLPRVNYGLVSEMYPESEANDK